MNSSETAYAVLTAAFNEEQFIEATIQSLLAQTIRPVAWVIVSDGSTDRTDSIIQQYSKEYPFISYLRTDRGPTAGIPDQGALASRRAIALAPALKSIAHLPYGYVAMTDAHVTVEPTFFALLLERMKADDGLGIAGGFVYNIIDGREVSAFVNPRNVGGPLQMYRRACLEEIGGFFPDAPHEDTVGLIMARMKAWRTRSFPDLKVYHYKATTWHGVRRLKPKFKLGTYDYMMGSTFLWEILRCVKEVPDSPAIIGSLLRIIGYCWACFNSPQILSQEALQYVRQEQYSTIRAELLARIRANQHYKSHAPRVND